MRVGVFGLLGLLGWLMTSPVSGRTKDEAFLTYQSLIQAENNQAIFSFLIAYPGAEYPAAYFGKRIPQEALNILVENGELEHNPRLLPVKGDLLAALGQNREALECYRQAARNLALSQVYLVDVDGALFEKKWETKHWRDVVSPFTYGPGSQVDNWLLRRFLALDATEDASREFARMWQVHTTLVDSGFFPARSRQFALDFAYFLQQNHREREAQAVLQTVLLQLSPPQVQTSTWFQNSLRSYLYNSPNGPAPEAFVRLAVGFFPLPTDQQAVLDALRKKIDTRTGDAAWVLAQWLKIKGDSAGAMQAELSYLQSGFSSKLLKIYRKAQALEAYGKVEEALAAYETAWTLFDVKEEVGSLQNDSAVEKIFGLEVIQRVGRVQSLRQWVMYALVRLSALSPLGEKYIAFISNCIEHDFDWWSLSESALFNVQRAFQNIGQPDGFAAWAKRMSAKNTRSDVFILLGFRLGDQDMVLDTIVKTTQPRWVDDRWLQKWKTGFAVKGLDWYRPLLERLVRAYPKCELCQWELLNLEGKLETPDMIRFYEMQLENLEANEANRAYQLALTLMKSYELTGNQAKMLSLALRLAKLEPPFAASANNYARGATVRENGEAAMTIAIGRLTDREHLLALQQALENTPWTVASRQLQRRLKLQPPVTVPGRESGFLETSDPNVKAVVSYENVISLCRDEAHLYVGHGWGVAVRDFQGRLERSVILGEAALTMVTAQGALWVGTPLGVVRVDLKTLKLARFSCDQDLTEGEKANIYRDLALVQGEKQPLRPERISINQVLLLTVQGDWLWVGTNRDIRRFNLKTGDLRIYLDEELGVETGQAWKKLWVDGPYVWADCGEGSRRYNSQTDRWELLQDEMSGPVHVIGLYQGKILGRFGQKNTLGGQLCLIDRETMAQTPLRMKTGLMNRPDLRNSPLYLFGDSTQNLLFGEYTPSLKVDLQTMTVTPIKAVPADQSPEFNSAIPISLQFGERFDRSDGLTRFQGRLSPPKPDDLPMAGKVWHALKLPNGTVVLGAQSYNSPQFEVPDEISANNQRNGYFTQTASGGLWWLENGSTKPKRMTKSSLGDAFFMVTPRQTDKTLWVGTNGGLTVLNEKLDMLDRLGEEDGLVSNHITKGLWVGPYFVTWNQSSYRGAISIYHTQTGGIRNVQFGPRIQDLTPASRPDRLKVTFQPDREGIPPPVEISLDNGTVVAAAEVAPDVPEAPVVSASASKSSFPPMPLLGGLIFGKVELSGKTYWYGSRGMLVTQGALPSVPEPPPLPVHLVPLQPAAQRLEAKSNPLPGKPPLEEFVRYAIGPNPYVLIQAINNLDFDSFQPKSPYQVVVLELLQHPQRQVRSAILQKINVNFGEAVVNALRRAVHGRYPDTAREAALALCQLGIVEDKALLLRMLGETLPRRFNKSLLIGALAQEADEAMFALWGKLPSRFFDGLESKPIAILASKVAEHPEYLRSFWQNQEPGAQNSEFLKKLVKQAGPALLPFLHETLRSPEHNLRVSAVVACGALGDVTSVPHLGTALAAADPHLARLMVQVLVELKATSVIPTLAQRFALSYRQERYEADPDNWGKYFAKEPWFPNVQVFPDHVDLNYATLKQTLRGRFGNLNRSDAIPLSTVIKNEVARLGAQANQAFYLELASAADPEVRGLAAKALVTPGFRRSVSLQVLRKMALDPEFEARVPAVVSLLMLGETSVQPIVLEWLGPTISNLTYLVLQNLARLRNTRHLDFAQEKIKNLRLGPMFTEAERSEVRQLMVFPGLEDKFFK